MLSVFRGGGFFVRLSGAAARTGNFKKIERKKVLKKGILEIGKMKTIKKLLEFIKILDSL